MIAHGEALGILHLRSGPRGRAAAGEKFRLGEAKQRLAAAVASHIALALANLRLREQLTTQANRDALTGVFSRRYLEEALEKELRRAGRLRTPVGLIMLDIDHFKRFNTTFTHLGGDELLRALGRHLQENFCRREGDIACRYGGEEFALVLPGASLEHTRARADELGKAVRRLRVRHEDRPLGKITISQGVAAFPEYGQTPESLIKAADVALMRAKKEGRDRVVTARVPGRNRR